MIDPVQAVLLFVIVLLTVLLLVLGFQIFVILRELRTTVKRANRLLETAESLTENINEPLSLLANIFSSSSILSLVMKVLNKHKDKEGK